MYEIDLYQGVILVLGGFVAGCINTLAGYGSVICLTLLMDVVGLPANLANGSNRLNVLVAGAIGSFVFYKNGRFDYGKSKWFIWITFIGAMFGVYLATVVSNEDFRGIFKYLVIVLLFLLLIRPKRWLSETSVDYNLPKWIMIPIFLVIGIYGGFIQMGVGLFALAALVIGARMSMIDANAVKLVMTTIYTIVVLAIFWYKGLVHWTAGGCLALGAGVGGWVTSNFASKFPQANLWAYRLLVGIICFILVYQFKIWAWFIDLF